MWAELKANFRKCMEEYPLHHQNPENQRYHLIGMPLIALGLALPFTGFWIAGVILFLTGCALLGRGHKVEGNRPALTTNLMHIVVGPVWYIRKVLRKDS